MERLELCDVTKTSSNVKYTFGNLQNTTQGECYKINNAKNKDLTIVIVSNENNGLPTLAFEHLECDERHECKVQITKTDC